MVSLSRLQSWLRALQRPTRCLVWSEAISFSAAAASRSIHAHTHNPTNALLLICLEPSRVCCDMRATAGGAPCAGIFLRGRSVASVKLGVSGCSCEAWCGVVWCEPSARHIRPAAQQPAGTLAMDSWGRSRACLAARLVVVVTSCWAVGVVWASRRTSCLGQRRTVWSMCMSRLLMAAACSVAPTCRHRWCLSGHGAAGRASGTDCAAGVVGHPQGTGRF